MNLIQEVSLGLVLLFGGESDAARRAGDALLADRIDEAVEEGGFERIDYDAWHKVSATVLAFAGVEIARGTAEVDVDAATVDPFSYALSFDEGRFDAANGDSAWRFGRVELRKAGFFSQRLRLTADRLERIAGPAAADAEPCTEDAPIACSIRVGVRGGIDRFVMNFTPGGEPGAVQLAWERAGVCHAVWSSDARRMRDLVSWGREVLAGADLATWQGAPVDCRGDLFEQAEGLAPLSFASRSAARDVAWADLYDGNEVLLDTLFSLVPESYAYLLE